MEKEFDNPLNLTKEQKARNITEPWGDFSKLPANVKDFDTNTPFMQEVRKLGKEIGLK